MPRPEFTTPGSRVSSGNLETNQRIQGSWSAEYIEWSFTSTVAASSDEIVELLPPEGYIWEFQALSLDVDAVPNSTTGNHWMEVRNLGGSYNQNSIYGRNSYNNGLNFRHSTWRTVDAANTAPDASNEAALMAVVASLIADDTSGIKIRYQNSTDADQTNTRTIAATVKQKRVE